MFEMKWSRIDLSKSTHQLLTSDRPINMPLGLADPEAYISLPVSPAMIFSSAREASVSTRCMNRFSKVLGNLQRADAMIAPPLSEIAQLYCGVALGLRLRQ